MICWIIAIFFSSSASGLHILPCEPGDPGPLGCDQFVANGGQLGTAAGQTAMLSQPGNAGSIAIDQSFWTDPRLQQANIVDPTQTVDLTSQFVDQNVQFIDPTTQTIDPNLQFLDPLTGQEIQNVQFIDPTTQMIDPNVQFIDPTTQMIDPNLQFIDPTQIMEPPLVTGVRSPGIDQSSGPLIPQGIEFVGQMRRNTLPFYPKGPKSKVKGKIGFAKGPIKQSLAKLYPKGNHKMNVLKKYLKIPNGHPKGKLNSFGKNIRIVLVKSRFGKLKLYILPGHSRYKKKYGRYPFSGSKIKMGYRGKSGILHPKRYTKNYIRSKKFRGGY